MRTVFDASVKKHGLSLKDTINAGLGLQNDLFCILVRFRKEKIAVVGDISEMYLQIKIHNEDRKFFRFLWRNGDTSKQPKTFEFSRVVFGITCSPFLVQFVSKFNAKLHKNQFQLAAETIQESTYVDNVLDSLDSEEKAILLCKQLIQMWDLANMTIRKWISNSPKVLKNGAP